MPARRRSSGLSSKRASSLTTGDGSDVPHMNTMRWIWVFPRNGMMPHAMGAVTPAFRAASQNR